jgi:hypothetical protein
MLDEGRLPPRRIALYVLLQTLTLVGCWIWFAVLWSIAFFSYTLADFEWWLLVGTAVMGLYGLRPNLERAIDAAWLRGIKNSKALAERVNQLKPIKRRIDVMFSIAVLVLLVLAALIWFSLTLAGIGGEAPGA